jgi:hypothetical protein
MTPLGRRYVGIMFAVLLLIGGCIVFPRMLTFVELASRELRYLWWLILIVAIGVWLTFFSNSRK